MAKKAEQFLSYTKESQIMAMTVEICREGDWNVILPAEGLASESIYLQSIIQENSKQDLFKVMQKVAQFWESRGVKNYLTYTNSREEGWEMVPYSGLEGSGWDELCSYARQVEVMTRVIWGRYNRSESEQERDYTEYKDIASVEVKAVADDMNGIGNDVFCQQATLDKQLIWEGKNTYILIGIENCTFALAKEASSHPPCPGSSFQ